MDEFYLTSSDGRELNAHPRRCRLLAVVTVGSTGNDRAGWLAELEPPLRGSDYGQSVDSIKLVIVTPRFVGDVLDSCKLSDPVHVYVLRPLPTNAPEVLHFTPDAYELLEWGEIHPTEVSARNSYYPPMHREKP